MVSYRYTMSIESPLPGIAHYSVWLVHGSKDKGQVFNPLGNVSIAITHVHVRIYPAVLFKALSLLVKILYTTICAYAPLP